MAPCGPCIQSNLRFLLKDALGFVPSNFGAIVCTLRNKKAESAGPQTRSRQDPNGNGCDVLGWCSDLGCSPESGWTLLGFSESLKRKTGNEHLDFSIVHSIRWSFFWSTNLSIGALLLYPYNQPTCFATWRKEKWARRLSAESEKRECSQGLPIEEWLLKKRDLEMNVKGLTIQVVERFQARTSHVDFKYNLGDARSARTQKLTVVWRDLWENQKLTPRQALIQQHDSGKDLHRGSVDVRTRCVGNSEVNDSRDDHHVCWRKPQERNDGWGPKKKCTETVYGNLRHYGFDTCGSMTRTSSDLRYFFGFIGNDQQTPFDPTGISLYKREEKSHLGIFSRNRLAAWGNQRMLRVNSDIIGTTF